MTNVIDVKRGEKVLEIGTGSGVQSAYIANLTENAYTIEIIKPLADRTRSVYDKADRQGLYRVQARQDQGRRRLLRLGRSGAVRQDHRHLRHRPCAAAASAAAQGRRPDGDPGRPAGRAARAQGRQDPGADGSITTSREDIYGGKIVPFVPFTKLDGDKIVGTHNR
jgi:protein-L-isoaspartate(D-aspartate) O-methyltransferase